MFKLIICLMAILFFTSCNKNRIADNIVNLNDSLSVRQFIIKTKLYDQISFVEKNKNQFIKNKGFSRLILGSVSKKVKMPFFIMIANGGIILSDEEIETDFQSQLDLAKSKCMQ